MSPLPEGLPGPALDRGPRFVPPAQLPLPPSYLCCDGTCQVLYLHLRLLPLARAPREQVWGSNSFFILEPSTPVASLGYASVLVCPCPLSSSVPGLLFVDRVLSLSFQDLSRLPGPAPTWPLPSPTTPGAGLSQQARSALNLLISVSPSLLLSDRFS